MVLVFFKTATSAIAGILAISSARNVLETALISSSPYPLPKSSSPIGSPLLQKYTRVDPHENVILSIDESMTSKEIVEDLNRMKRGDLLKLFALCNAPQKRKEVCGSYDGTLLNNNIVLTAVSGFISNNLFGRNHGLWNGKTFGWNGIGVNRFSSTRQPKKVDGNNEPLAVENEHHFDFKISPSERFKGKAVSLNYEKYQPMLSPWKSMKDEVRVLRRRSKRRSKEGILLGIGSMGWSGSFWNCTPFCLVEVKKDI